MSIVETCTGKECASYPLAGYSVGPVRAIFGPRFRDAHRDVGRVLGFCPLSLQFVLLMLLLGLGPTNVQSLDGLALGSTWR